MRNPEGLNDPNRIRPEFYEDFEDVTGMTFHNGAGLAGGKVCFRSSFKASSGSSGRVEGGPKNMKSMRSNLAAIFFYDLFLQFRGEWPPRPLDPLLKALPLTERSVFFFF